MRLGEVRVAEDKDFEELVTLADRHDGWKAEFCNKSLNVWSRDTHSETSKMVKVRRGWGEERISIANKGDAYL